MKCLASLSAIVLLGCGGSRGGAPPPALHCSAPVVVPRAAGHTATLLADGTVLVAGGLLGQGGATPAAERLDPSSLRATAAGPMSTPRAWHTSTLLASGKVLITGGSPRDGSAIALATAETFDPRTGTFTPTHAPMSCPRHSHTATRLRDGTVLLTGGDGPNPDAVWATAELYDPATDTFRLLAAPMTTSRTLHTASLLASGQVLIAGGTNWLRNLQSAETYDPGRRAFTATRGRPGRVYVGHCAEALDSGSLLLAGHQGADLYLPTTGTFTPVTGLSSSRSGAALVALPGIGAALLGGERSPPTSPPTPCGTVDVFRADRSTFEQGTALTAPRSGLRSVRLEDGRILAVGGTGPGQLPLTTFEILAEP